MKTRALLLALVMLFGLATSQATALNEWTFIVYMVNDDDESAIEDANIRNLNDMVRIGAGEGNEIIVQMDGRKGGAGGFWGSLFGGSKDDLRYSGGQRLTVQKGKIVSEAKLGEVNMGSPYCLWDCLKWAQEKHPARHYALIFNSHGSGVFSWRGTGGTSSSKPGAVDFDPGRFVAYDDTDNDCLTVFEIAAVLKAFREKLNMGHAMDIVGFDACLPAGIEALYQLRDAFAYLIGSPDTTNINGFNYRGIAEELVRQPKIAPEAFATLMARKMNNSDMGAWRCAKAQEVVFAVNNLTIEVAKAVKETGQPLSLRGIRTFGGKNYYWDLGEIATALADGRSNLSSAKNAQVIRQLAGEALEGLKAARLTSWGGLTIACPAAADYAKFQSFYKALDFAQATQWDEILDQR